MSHSTVLHKFSRNEIARFDRAGFGNSDRNTIYEVLGFNFANAGVSGDGSSWVLDGEDYTNHDFILWKEKARKNGADDFIKFINVLIDRLKKGKTLLISFN